MLQTASRLLPELPLFLMTAVATHLVMSFAQTLMHYKLGHHSMGGKFFRNHINFHHTYYSKDHLVSPTYLVDDGNNTPFFFVPVFLVGARTFFVLPVDLLVAQVVACAASFYAHVFFDKEYHVEGSRLQRFAWFRRKQELHFVHHRHANSNFAVIHFFWDRILGTYRRPDAGQTQANGILMPADYCLRLDNLQRVQCSRSRTIECCKHQAVNVTERQSLRGFAPQHVELMSKDQELGLQRSPRAEQSDQGAPDQPAKIPHLERVSSHSPPRPPTSRSRSAP